MLKLCLLLDFRRVKLILLRILQRLLGTILVVNLLENLVEHLKIASYNERFDISINHNVELAQLFRDDVPVVELSSWGTDFFELV